MHIPVVVSFSAPLFQILPGLVLKLGLPLLVLSVVDWGTLSLTDLLEKLV